MKSFTLFENIVEQILLLDKSKAIDVTQFEGLEFLITNQDKVWYIDAAYYSCLEQIPNYLDILKSSELYSLTYDQLVEENCLTVVKTYKY